MRGGSRVSARARRRARAAGPPQPPPPTPPATHHRHRTPRRPFCDVHRVVRVPPHEAGRFKRDALRRAADVAEPGRRRGRDVRHKGVGGRGGGGERPGGRGGHKGLAAGDVDHRRVHPPRVLPAHVAQHARVRVVDVGRVHAVVRDGGPARGQVAREAAAHEDEGGAVHGSGVVARVESRGEQRLHVFRGLGVRASKEPEHALRDARGPRFQARARRRRGRGGSNGLRDERAGPALIKLPAVQGALEAGGKDAPLGQGREPVRARVFGGRPGLRHRVFPDHQFYAQEVDCRRAGGVEVLDPRDWVPVPRPVEGRLLTWQRGGRVLLRRLAGGRGGRRRERGRGREGAPRIVAARCPGQRRRRRGAAGAPHAGRRAQAGGRHRGRGLRVGVAQRRSRKSLRATQAGPAQPPPPRRRSVESALPSACARSKSAEACGPLGRRPAMGAFCSTVDVAPDDLYTRVSGEKREERAVAEGAQPRRARRMRAAVGAVRASSRPSHLSRQPWKPASTDGATGHAPGHRRTVSRVRARAWRAIGGRRRRRRCSSALQKLEDRSRAAFARAAPPAALSRPVGMRATAPTPLPLSPQPSLGRHLPDATPPPTSGGDRGGGAPSPPPRPTTPLGAPSSWTRGDLIGSGAFGRVYLGLDDATGRLVAVKQVSLATDAGAARRAAPHVAALESEVALLAGLSHPNIVRYLVRAGERE